MTRPVPFLLLPFLSTLLLFGSVGGVLASSPTVAAHRHAARMAPVTLMITTTNGIVWGTVTAKYTFGQQTMRRSCSAATCTLRIPQGVTLHLSQVARNTATWPFKDWQITTPKRTQTRMAKRIAVKVTGSLSVSAEYVLTRSASSSSGGSGSYWP